MSVTAAHRLRGLLVIALALGGPGAAGSQEPVERVPAIVEEDLAEDVDALLEEAEELFATAEQPRSIALFSQIIGLLERRQEAGQLDGIGRERLSHSLFRRAEARFNIGERERAEEDLTAILRLDPAYAVPLGTVSPKLVELLETARAAAVGVLDPLVEPSDAELVLDGESLGALRGPRPVLAGARHLLVRRPGYTPVEMEIEVPAGSSLPVELALERASAVVRLFTRPAGVEVVIGGRVAAVSEPREEAGDEASAELAVEGLGIGEQVLELRKAGYRSAEVRVEVETLTDYTVAPVILEPTRGTVTLSGVPAAARILVDGRPLTAGEGGDGRAIELPPGAHRILVAAGDGALFEEEVELADREVLELVVRLRPSLVLLGVLGGDRVAATGLGERLETGLRGLVEWALVDRAEQGFELVREAGLDRELLRALRAETVTRQEPDWGVLQTLLDRELGGSVYLLAVLSDDLFASQADLWLWSAAPGPERPVTRRVPLEQQAAFDELAEQLDRPLELFAPWLGARLIDSRLADAPLVASVEPGGPAAAAGLRPGDRVTTIAGEPVGDCREAEARIAGLAIGSEVTLDLIAGGEARRATVTLGRTPLVLPLSTPGLMDPAYAARLAVLEGAEAGSPGWLLRLNRAVLLMRSGEWRRAVPTLRGIAAPATPGVGQATVDYLLGLALLEADRGAYLDAARELIGKAAAGAGRLHHNDGPAIAPRAQARLETLLP